MRPMPIYFANDVKLSDNTNNYVLYDNICLSQNNPYYEVLSRHKEEAVYGLRWTTGF